jgi:cell wall-associated NlpC family hydrolase
MQVSLARHRKLNIWGKLGWMLTLLWVAGTGCASSSDARAKMRSMHQRVVNDTPASFHPRVRVAPDGSYTHNEIYNRLYREVIQWEGTPHLMGGTSRHGVDCSGFVMTLYRKLFDVRLPRTTKDQVRVGKWVPVEALQPGDLVFFHPPRKVRHVGIYLGDGRFVHVSAIRGVTISNLDTPYYRNAYWTARRVLSI